MHTQIYIYAYVYVYVYTYAHLTIHKNTHIYIYIFRYLHAGTFICARIINTLPILDTLQKNKFFAGERRYSHWYQKTKGWK